MSSDGDAERKQLKGFQLAALGVCTFIFVVVGGLLVLAGGGVGPKPAASASQAAAAPR